MFMNWTAIAEHFQFTPSTLPPPLTAPPPTPYDYDDDSDNTNVHGDHVAIDMMGMDMNMMKFENKVSVSESQLLEMFSTNVVTSPPTSIKAQSTSAIPDATTANTNNCEEFEKSQYLSLIPQQLITKHDPVYQKIREKERENHRICRHSKNRYTEYAEEIGDRIQRDIKHIWGNVYVNPKRIWVPGTVSRKAIQQMKWGDLNELTDEEYGYFVELE